MHLPETIVDGVAVGGGDSTKTPNKPLKRKSIVLPVILVALVLFVVVVVGVVLIHKHDELSNKQVYSVCNSPANEYLLKDAAVNFSPDNILALKGVATKIQQLPGYQKDQSCDYVELRYYLNSGNGPGAVRSLSNLKEYYVSKGTYSKYLQPGVIPVTKLNYDTTSLQSAYKQAAKNGSLIVVRKP